MSAVRQLSVSQIVRRVFRMAILLVMARMLGVETFGIYALLLTIVEFIALISGYGYMDFLTREVAQRPGAAWPLGRRMTQLRLAYIAPSLGLALLALSVLRFPSSLMLNAALLSLTLVPRAASESAQGLLKGLGRFAPLPWIELTQGALVLASAPVLILEGLGIRGVIAAESLGAWAGAVIAVWSATRRLNVAGSDPRGFRELIRSTFAFNVYPFIVTVYDRVDVILLSKLAGNVATGIYALPYRAFATLGIIPYSVMGALLPVFSSSPVSRDMPRACSGAMKFLYVTSLLIALWTLTFAGPVVLFVLGRSYADSIVTINVLVWAAVPAFLNAALNTLLLAAGKEKLFLRTSTVCTIFNITTNLLLIPRFSFLGAAVVTVLTECLLLAQNLFWVERLVGRLVLPQDGLKITLAFAVTLASFWLLQRSVPWIWAGGLASGAFAMFAVGRTGLRHFRLAAGHQGAK